MQAVLGNKWWGMVLMSLTDKAAIDPAADPTSVDVKTNLCEEERILLRRLAYEAVAYGLLHGRHLPVNVARYPPPLREPGASFVTLKLHGELRGCIGSLEAHRPLAEDVAHNAYAAAFADPRFPPLTDHELTEVDFHLSILSPAVPMSFNSEADLLRQLRPGIDGLILEDGIHRGTFLPSVWESLPDAAQFFQQLKRKAGLPTDHWSSTLKVARYTCESF